MGHVSVAFEPFRIVFVCTGNICRSPMAEVVLRWFADQSGFGERVVTDSAGTGEWHVGEPADHRTLDVLAAHGYDGSRHRARQFTVADFDRFDLIVALDRSHERALRSWAPTPAAAEKIALMMSFAASDAEPADVPDPYYAGPDMFAEVLGMIEAASRALFRQLEPAIRPSS